MGFVSTTFKVMGNATLETKTRIAAAVERHRPKMDKVVDEARKLARDLKAVEDFRKSLRTPKDR